MVEDDYYVGLQAAGFPDNSAGKGSTYNAEDLGLIARLGRSSGEGNGYPLQYSGLKNPMDREPKDQFYSKYYKR